MKLYHYSSREHKVGDVITAGSDSYGRLKSVEPQVEDLLRAKLPDGEKLRGESLYTWRDPEVAERLWKINRNARYLYELEVDEIDELFRSDLNHYNDAKIALEHGKSPDQAVARYCKAAPPLMHHIGTRIEVLVRRARVVAKLKAK